MAKQGTSDGHMPSGRTPKMRSMKCEGCGEKISWPVSADGGNAEKYDAVAEHEATHRNKK